MTLAAKAADTLNLELLTHTLRPIRETTSWNFPATLSENFNARLSRNYRNLGKILACCKNSSQIMRLIEESFETGCRSEPDQVREADWAGDT